MRNQVKKGRIYYDLYQLAKKSGFHDYKNNQIMTHVLGHERWSFRVTGISRQACSEIKKAGFRRPAAYLLERDHTVRSRGETYKKIFSKNMSFKAWWDFVWEGDATIITTRHENRSDKVKSEEIIPLDWEEGFFEGQDIGFKCRVRTEGIRVKELCEQYQID